MTNCHELDPFSIVMSVRRCVIKPILENYCNPDRFEKQETEKNNSFLFALLPPRLVGGCYYDSFARHVATYDLHHVFQPDIANLAL